MISAIQTVTIANRTNGKVSVTWHVPTRRTDKEHGHENEIEKEIEKRGRESRENFIGNERNKSKDECDFQGSNKHCS